VDLKALCDTIGESAPSQVLQSTSWAVPAIQSVHILALSVVLASMAMLASRLVGLTARAHSLAAVARYFIPPTWLALVVLLFSGAALIVAEPARELLNPAFRWKMVLLVLAIVMLTVLHRRLRRADSDPPRRMALVAPVFLGVWITIAFLGRWIAYQDTGG
jgi:hypothetical protein